MEEMRTAAILEDRFTGPLRKIAAAQDDYSKRTMALNVAGNVTLGISAGVIALGVASTVTAAKVDTIRKALTAVEGATKAAFDIDYVNNYAKTSSQTFLNLLATARLLGTNKLPVQDIQQISDIAAATGDSLDEVARLYRMIQGNDLGRALGPMGFGRFGVRTSDIFAAEGLNFKQGQKIEGSITPEQVFDAIPKVLQKMGLSGLDQKMATTTLPGSLSMVQDSVDRLMAAFGSANLDPTIKALNSIAGVINNIGDAVKAHPEITKYMEVAAGFGLVAGGVMKGVAAYRTYQTILKAVSKAAKDEQALEGVKPGLANAEGDAVAGTATAYETQAQKLRAAMIAAEDTAKASTTAATEAEVLGTAGVTAGVGMKSFALSMEGIPVLLTKIKGLIPGLAGGLMGMGRSVATFFGGAAAMSALGLGAVAAGATGLGWGIEKILGQNDIALNGVSKMQAMPDTAVFIDHIAKLRHELKSRPNDPTILKQIADEMEFLNKISGHADLVKQRAADAKAISDKKAADARAAAVAAANTYELSPQMDYMLKADQRRVELLELQHKSQKAIGEARQQEIKDLATAQALLVKNADLATDAKQKYKLLDEANEKGLEIAKLKAEQTDSKINQIISKAFGGDGIVSESFLRQIGISPMSLRQMNKGTFDAHRQMAERSHPIQVVVHNYLDSKLIDEKLQKHKVQILNNVNNTFLNALETSQSGTGL